MPEPVTIAALAIGALTWAGVTALGGHVGNVTDRLCCNLLRAYRHRIAGSRGRPENHDLARAVRMAQMQALERLIADFRQLHEPAWNVAPGTCPEAFLTEGIAFCRHTVGRSYGLHVQLNLDVTDPLDAAINGILGEPTHDGAAVQRIEAIAFFAENAVLDELREQLGDVALPADFEMHFRKGNGEEHPRFLDLFGAYIVEQIKDHPKVLAILTTGQLARIEGLAFDATEMLYRVETHFAGAIGEFRVLIDRLTADLSLSNAEKVALAVDLSQVKAELSGTKALVGGFLDTMVGRRLPPEQFATTLFRIAADWKIAGERIDALSVSRNLTPQLAALKTEAHEAHGAGRLDAAMEALAEIDRIESEALDRLTTHEREIQEEMRLRRVGIAKTREAQAAVARVRLAYRDAAEHYAAAARVIAPIDVREEWRLTLEGVNVLVHLGDEFGDNDALLEAIKAFRDDVLPRAARECMPLDWAITQNDFGNALHTLGGRENRTARLEEALAAHRAALEERTRDRGQAMQSLRICPPG